MFGFLKSAFIIDVLKLVFGNAGSYIVFVAATPLLTRIYSPEKFGLFSIFYALVQVIGSATSLSYDFPVLNAKKRNEAFNIVSLALSVNLASVSALTVIAVILTVSGIRIFQSPWNGFVLLISPAVLFIGTGSVLGNWFIREKKFDIVSYSKFINTFVMVGTQLVLGCLLPPDYSYLVYGFLIGSFASVSFLAFHFIKKHGNDFIKAVSFERSMHYAGRYKNFPLFVTPAAVMNTFSWQTPVYLLGYFFNAGITGLYSLGMRLIQVPMNLIGQSISQVVHQRSAIVSKDGMSDFVMKIYRALVNVMLLPSAILLLLGEDVFSLFLGSEWRMSGLYSQILAPWAFVWFISTPLNRILYILEKQRFIFLLNIVILLSRVVSISIGGIAKNPLVSIFLFSVTGFMIYGFLNYMIMRYSGVRYREVIRETGKAFVVNLPFILILLIVKIFLHSTVFIIISIVVASAGYIIINLRHLKFIGVKHGE
jgi:lipopolysaccharide exporter